MTKTIGQLWNGNLEPIRYFGMHNAESKQLENIIQRNLEELENLLSKKATDVFEKYHDHMHEYITILSEQAFCDGFCLGTKLVTEALHGAEDIV